MRCETCGAPLRLVRRDYPYTECGLENVTLVGAAVYVCRRHGVQAVALSNIEGIHEDIARALLHRQAPLGGREVRFLRKHREWTQPELARRLGVTEVTVCRWETGATPIGPANQQRLRLLFTDPEAFAASQVAQQRPRVAAPPLRIPAVGGRAHGHSAPPAG